MSSVAVVASPRAEVLRHSARDVTLIDLLDRLLQGGIVVQGDITLAVADIDLVDLSLRLIVGAVDAVGPGRGTTCQSCPLLTLSRICPWPSIAAISPAPGDARLVIARSCRLWKIGQPQPSNQR